MMVVVKTVVVAVAVMAAPVVMTVVVVVVAVVTAAAVEAEAGLEKRAVDRRLDQRQPAVGLAWILVVYERGRPAKRRDRSGGYHSWHNIIISMIARLRCCSGELYMSGFSCFSRCHQIVTSTSLVYANKNMNCSQ